MYMRLQIALLLLQLYTPKLRELSLCLNVGDCEFGCCGRAGQPDYHSGHPERILDSCFYELMYLHLGGALGDLKRFVVKGLPKTEGWNRIRELELGVDRDKGDTMIKDAWGNWQEDYSPYDFT